MDDTIDDNRQRRKEIGGVDFGVKEDFGGEESLVTHVDGDLTTAWLRDYMLGEPGAVAVEFRKLLDDIGAYIAVLLLYFLGRL